LIKAGFVPEKRKEKPPADDIPVSEDTMSDWIDEFKAKKADRIRRDLKELVGVKKGSRTGE
jgi:hypothetical protein